MHFSVPVHFNLPVGSRGQRDPGDLSSEVAIVNTTKDHLAALLTVAKGERKKNNVICKNKKWKNHTFTQSDSYPVSVPAQVDGEHGLRHKSLTDHVVKDRHNIVRGNRLEGQSQDTISLHVSHVWSLCLANAEHLFGHRQTTNLEIQDSCQSQLN